MWAAPALALLSESSAALSDKAQRDSEEKPHQTPILVAAINWLQVATAVRGGTLPGPIAPETDATVALYKKRVFAEWPHATFLLKRSCQNSAERGCQNSWAEERCHNSRAITLGLQPPASNLQLPGSFGMREA